MPEIQLIDESLILSVIEKAKQSPRKRTNHNFHQLDEVYQRFLNVVTKGTYVQVHRHKSEPKPETFLLLQGSIGFLTFSDNGDLENKFLLSSEGKNRGIDLAPGVWHALVCLTDIAVCFEGKSGPYNPNSDKEFHPRYPQEGEEKAKDVVLEWEKLF